MYYNNSRLLKIFYSGKGVYYPPPPHTHTQDCFLNNLPDLSQLLRISNSTEKLDDVTETMDFRYGCSVALKED